MTLKYRNFKAWIYCEDNGDILEEFEAGPDPEDEGVCTCWVASEAGKRFTVHWESLMKNVCDNKGVTYVDGVEAHSYVNTSSSNKDGASSGVKTATGDIRPYAFSDVVLTDDDTYLGVEQSTNTDELGNITLKIYLVKTRFVHRRRPKPRHHNRQCNEVSLFDGAIHETTKKICDHRITLGDAIPFGPPRVGRPGTRKLVWEPYDPEFAEPHVTFRFKYRPRAYLQAQGIIPFPAYAEGTPAKPIILNHENQEDVPKRVSRKRKRPLMNQDSSQRNIEDGRANSHSELPLFLPNPSLLREQSQPAQNAIELQPVFFATPCRSKQEDDIVFLGYSERKTGVKQESASPLTPLVRNVRMKQEPITPMKMESTPMRAGSSGLRLWMDSHGTIDLTVEE